jgi:hypothetical protein
MRGQEWKKPRPFNIEERGCITFQSALQITKITKPSLDLADTGDQNEYFIKQV